jgi:hypothetical protein
MKKFDKWALLGATLPNGLQYEHSKSNFMVWDTKESWSINVQFKNDSTVVSEDNGDLTKRVFATIPSAFMFVSKILDDFREPLLT